MKTLLSFPGSSGWVTGFILAAGLLVSAARADVPDGQRVPVPFQGVYKVKSSNDPAFIVSPACEYFLDFGRGQDGGKPAGSVAVSVRVNPNVKVRILSWEYFPDKNLLLIGSPFAHGSRNAVAIGAWRLRGSGESLVFSRERCKVLLVRADPRDY
jgi:hypothetical protein